MSYPWRVPDEETVDLYPGLVVHDGRVSGSITAGRSRLPLWALTGDMRNSGWDSVEENYEPGRYGWNEEQMLDLFHDLLQLRGEFGRLLLVLADAERHDRESDHLDASPWWQTPYFRESVRDQLRRCLDALDRDVPR